MSFGRRCRPWLFMASTFVALWVVSATVSTAWAFSQAMPNSPAIPQGHIAERARQVERLAPRQPLGDSLPLDMGLTDWRGRSVTLRDYFGQGPGVLVLGYYRCPNLCGTVMQGVLEALAATGLPPASWRVVYLSVDPDEDAALAADRRSTWMSYFNEVAVHGTPGQAAPRPSSPPSPSSPSSPSSSSGDLRLDTLVGSERAVTAIAAAAGFRIEPDEPGTGTGTGMDKDTRQRASADASRALSRYAHPAEFMIATPDGRLSRFVFGIRFDARDLRLALVDASHGAIGNLADQLVLLCSHFDPATGRYDDAVMGVMRVIGLACVVAIGLYAWTHRHGGGAREASA